MLIHDIIGLFSHELAIDLGTSCTRVALRDSDRIVSTPTAVCIETRSGRMLFKGEQMGEAADGLAGRAPPGIKVVRPVRRGVVADARAAAELLSTLISRLHGRRWAVRPTAIAAYPAGASEAERETLLRTLTAAGVRKVYLVDNLTAALAGAYGAADARCHLIADLGAGKIDFGIMSVSGGGQAGSVSFGGDDLALSLARKLRDECSIDLTHAEARKLLAQAGLPDPSDKTAVIDRPGSRDEISPVHIAAALRPELEQIRIAIEEILRNTRASEETADLAPEVVLAGGMVLVPGLAQWISAALNLPVRVPPEPQEAVIRGLRALSVRTASLADWAAEG